MKLSVAEYIQSIKEKNSTANERTETRANFFYVPKLNEMMLMEKVCTPKSKINNVQLYIMKCNREKKYDLSKLSKGQRTNFFFDNERYYEVYPDVSVATMLSYADKEDYINLLAPTINHLSLLKVHQYYRGLGLSKELINELINETAIYGYPYIRARMSPLDFTADPNPEENLRIEELIHEISPERKLSQPVDLNTLANIYEKLGFTVPDDYETNRNIVLPVKYANIKKRDLYPEEFCENEKHKSTPIIVR